MLWALAYPVYQVIGTIRHEAGHALAAISQGAEIIDLVFLPSIADGQFYFGYVRWKGATNIFVLAAPYFLDLLVFLVFFYLCYYGRFKRHWLWLNLVIVGILSPLMNSGYQYLKSWLNMGGDIARLVAELPAVWVHAYMISVIVLYLVGTPLVVKKSRHIRERSIQTNREEEKLIYV